MKPLLSNNLCKLDCTGVHFLHHSLLVDINDPLANASTLSTLLLACTCAAIWWILLQCADFAKFVWLLIHLRSLSALVETW